jgi:O-antigen/teichoic acid export membrane protein
MVIIGMPKYSGKSFKNLGEFVLMAASVLVFSKLLDFLIRDHAIQTFGFHQTGLWQSVVRLSDGYMMIFINTVGVVYYPQIASLIFDVEQLRSYLQGVIKVVAPVSAIGLLFVFFLRDPILTILYSKEFTSAGILMPFQLIGDFFCILSYLLTYIISAQARTRIFIALQAGSAMIYVLFIILLENSQGIMALPAAHALRFSIVFIILVIVNKRILF